MSWPMVKPTVVYIYRNYSHYSHYKEKPAKIIFGGYGVSVHLFPFRTEKLSLTSPMILHLFVEK